LTLQKHHDDTVSGFPDGGTGRHNLSSLHVPTTGTVMTFNGFISYSHAADGRLAPAVQRGLHTLARPWHRRRALWIFRDQTGLSVTPALWSSIQKALDGSDYFVLLASPEAARSQWVNREIEHWIATKSADQILPVVTDGEWAWDPERRDFTGDSTAVPAALRGVFAEEPLFLDLRWARGSEHLSLQHSRFRDAIAQLAAPMHGVSKDELEGEDVRQHRRARRLLSGAVVTLVVLTMLAALTSVSAVRNAERARGAAAEALLQQRVAEEQRGSAERSAQEANRQQELALQQQSLARQQKARAADAAGEAKRSEQLAREQQRLADRAAAEARRQQGIADQAAKRTKKEQRRAKEAAQRAQRMEQEAQRQEKEARRLARIAEQKQREARKAAEEARKQQAKADRQQKIAVTRRLTNQARATVAQDPKTALMLGAAAQSLLPDRETRGEVSGVVTATSYAGTIDDVMSATYAPDGVLVTLGADGIVSMWNVTDRPNPVRIARLDGLGEVDDLLKLSPDGRTLAVRNRDELIVLWDVANRSRPALLAALPYTSWPIALAWSGNGKRLAVGGNGGIATVWDTTDRRRPVRLTTLTEHPKYMIGDVALNPDGRQVVLAQDFFGPTYDLTDPAEPVELRSIRGWDIGSMTYDRSGTVLAVGDYTGAVSFFDMTPAATTPTGPPPPDPPRPQPSRPQPSRPQPTGPEPSLLSPPPMEPFQEPENEPVGRQLTGLSGHVGAIAYSPDGRLLAAGDGQGTAMVWNMTQGEDPVPVTTVRAHGGINTVSFAPDGKTLVVADASATATLWNATPGFAPDPLAAVTVPGGHVQAAAFRPDGRSLLAAGRNGTANSWNVTNPARPVRGAGRTVHDGEVRAVAYSADRRTVAAVGRLDGRVRLTDLTGSAPPVTLPDPTESTNSTLPAPAGSDAVAFSPDGRTLAVVVGDTQVLLWDLTHRSRPVLRGTLGDGVRFGAVMAFSPDGRTLATGGADRNLTLWNVAVRSVPAKVATLAGHTAPAGAVAFSPDGHTVASGSSDASAMLWDVTDRARPTRLAVMAGHTGAVTSLAFSPDGHTLVTSDRNSVAMMWDTANSAGPIRLVSIPGLDGVANSVFFRGDGRTLAVAAQSGGERATVSLWSYPKLNSLRADPAKYACATTGRGLTAAEWARFIPEFPYRRSCR
jgi:WD40 repeat protein